MTQQPEKMADIGRTGLIADKGPQKLCLALFFLLWLIVACAPQPSVSVNPPLVNEGEVFLFLQPMGEKAAPITFTLGEVVIQRTDGVSFPLSLSFHELVGVDRIHTQSLLAKARVPAGTYQGLSLTVEEAEIMTEDGPVALQTDQGPLLLPLEMKIAPKKAVSFFLTFHADKSLEAHVLFRPVFSVTTSSQLPLARLGYISMPLANDLFIFHDSSMFFTGVIATGMLPRGMAIDRQRSRLYAALEEDAIAVIDMSQQAVIGNIRLRLGDDPQEIALSPDGDSLVSANYGSNTVSIVDPIAMVELGRVVVGSGPSSVAFSQAGNVAYSMDSLANNISVIDPEKMVLSASIHLEESPLKGALNRTDSELYVITANSPNLLVIDLSGAGGTQKIFVGMGARSILVDTRSNFVYVGRRDGEIAIVDPAIRAYIDTIQLDGPIESMAISDEENFLFVLLGRQHALNKVNLTSKEVMASIDLTGEGYAISLVGAR